MLCEFMRLCLRVPSTIDVGTVRRSQGLRRPSCLNCSSVLTWVKQLLRLCEPQLLNVDRYDVARRCRIAAVAGEYRLVVDEL